MHYEPQAHKEGRINAEDKPAVIHVDVPCSDGGTTIDATHHIINDDTGVVSIYEGSRSDGIDIQTHISRCVIDRRPSDADTGPGTGAVETVNEDSDEHKVVPDGGQLESTVLVDSRTPDLYRDSCPATFTITLGDEAVIGEKIGEVTGIELSTSDTPHITVSLGDFEATIKAGYWKCEECDRLATAYQYGQIRVCLHCQAQQRRYKRDRPADDDRAGDDVEVLR